MSVLSVNFHFTGNKVAGVICSNHMLSMKIHIFKTSYSKNYMRNHLGDALTYKTFHSLDGNSQVFLRMLITCMMVVIAESHHPAPGSAIPREALVHHGYTDLASLWTPLSLESLHSHQPCSSEDFRLHHCSAKQPISCLSHCLEVPIAMSLFPPET